MTTAQETNEVPELHFTDLPMATDRAAGWAELRAAGPVVLDDGWYYLTRREDVLAALRNPELFSSQKAFEMLGAPLPLVPIAYDPPEHTRFRRILHPFFGPGTMGSMQASLQAQAKELVENIAAKDGCEAIAELATPYPSRVFLTVFGLPLKDRDRLVGWKDAIRELSSLPSLEGADLTPVIELTTYLTDAIAELRRDPDVGLLSQVLRGDEALNDAEALGLGYTFVLAGLDTVTSAIGTALLMLAQRPLLRAQLREDLDQLDVFIEEVVRLEPPAPVVPRVTTEATTIAGVTLPAGSRVRLCLGAINRDGSDPTSGDDIVMDGKIHKHWGFGGGPHRCIGAHLARIELRIILAEWLQKIPEFELAPGYRPDIIWPSITFGVSELPLRFTR